MPYSAEAIANELLRIAQGESAEVSPMKLQKLVYYSHGWGLAINDAPLIHEQIQAWKYGPVIPALYHEFKDFGNSPITRQALELRVTGSQEMETFAPDIESEPNGAEEDSFAHALVARIWELYGQYSPTQLSRMTHEAGTPWHQVAAKFKFDPPPGINIPNELIAQYFKAKMNPNNNAGGGA